MEGYVNKYLFVCTCTKLYFYLQILDVVFCEKPNNLANSTDSLPLHSDLVTYESPPGIQLLHCIKSVANLTQWNDTLSLTSIQK